MDDEGLDILKREEDDDEKKKIFFIFYILFSIKIKTK